MWGLKAWEKHGFYAQSNVEYRVMIHALNHQADCVWMAGRQERSREPVGKVSQQSKNFTRGVSIHSSCPMIKMVDMG